MQQLHQLFKEISRLFINAFIDGLFKTGFHPFKIPATEIVPDQGINRFENFT